MGGVLEARQRRMTAEQQSDFRRLSGVVWGPSTRKQWPRHWANGYELALRTSRFVLSGEYRRGLRFGGFVW